jgi:uncharacterized RDD family membrane protein YckC
MLSSRAVQRCTARSFWADFFGEKEVAMVNAPPPPPSWSGQQQVAAPESLGPPAGFWLRFVAYIVDAFILMLAVIVVAVVIVGLAVAIGGTSGKDSDVAIGIGVVLAVLAYLVIGWLYEAFLTSGPHGATLGKQAVGVRILCADGTPLSFGRATGRHFLKVMVTPMIPFAIGYLMAAFTARKRALHDVMADTFVIKTEGPRT